MFDRQTLRDASLDLSAQGLEAAATWIGDKLSARVAARLVGKVGSRFVPGVGTALLAYDVADMGYSAITGESLSDTKFGRAVTNASSSAGRQVFNGAGKLFDSMGFATASEFIRTDATAYFFGAAPTPDSASNLQLGSSTDQRAIEDHDQPVPFSSKVDARDTIERAKRLFSPRHDEVYAHLSQSRVLKSDHSREID